MPYPDFALRAMWPDFQHMTYAEYDAYLQDAQPGEVSFILTPEMRMEFEDDKGIPKNIRKAPPSEREIAQMTGVERTAAIAAREHAIMAQAAQLQAQLDEARAEKEWIRDQQNRRWGGPEDWFGV